MTQAVQNKGGTQTIDRPSEKRKLKRPKKYNIIFHNDDYTPFEFVEELLMKVFRRTESESAAIAKEVDKTGKGLAGTYTFEIAETKLAKANLLIKETDYPLLLTMEQE